MAMKPLFHRPWCHHVRRISPLVCERNPHVNEGNHLTMQQRLWHHLLRTAPPPLCVRNRHGNGDTPRTVQRSWPRCFKTATLTCKCKLQSAWLRRQSSDVRSPKVSVLLKVG